MRMKSAQLIIESLIMRCWNTHCYCSRMLTPASVQDKFRLGVFSSASFRTVSTVLPMIRQAAKQPQGQAPMFGDATLIFTRRS